MNIREIAKLSPNYFEINREERNYAAILFAALCRPNNAEHFLKLCGIENHIGHDFGIYFEYSYIRDLWNKITNEETKREIIRQHLRINGISEILRLPPKEINQKFGVSGEASNEFVQYPGNWTLVKYNKNFADNDDFLNICRFKWSFNIKPDIVIHLDKNRAICIEAKYESGEGKYPADKNEKSIFSERGLDRVGQTELQTYMMNKLLGITTEFIFLVFKKAKSETHRVLTWAEVFNNLSMDEMPNFAIQMAKRISG